MIHIEIRPAHGSTGGYITAKGHASTPLICNSVTAIVECMAANIAGCWDIKVRRRKESGNYDFAWMQTDRKSRGVERANKAASFAYNGLRALEDEYPGDLHVHWVRKERKA